jgi:hypothetical protein
MKIHNLGFTGDYGERKPITEAATFTMQNRPPCYSFYDSIQGNRKLTSLDEVTVSFDVNDATEKERHCLYQLPIRSISDEEANDLFECRPPGGYQFFILRYHGQFYFVDTQGFSYSRYVTRLKNFDQPDSGI